MENQTTKRTIIPISCDVIKTGTATKDGKSWKWTLYRVEAVVLPAKKQQTFSTFDDFTGRINQETEVEVETKVVTKDGKTYTNYNIRLPKRSPWDELNDLKMRVEKLEAKQTYFNPSIQNPTASEPSLGDPDKEASPEDAFEEPLPF